jgi:glucose-6-phosphate isomerase
MARVEGFTAGLSFSFSPGSLADRIAAEAGRAQRASEGLRRRDPSVWSTDPSVQQRIANRLGWLKSPELMAASIDRLTAFAERTRQSGFTDVVLLGMGGSSLAPEVLRAIIGSAPGYPVLHVLDSTDPAAVLAVDTPPRQTLYILASKSGSTIEPNTLAAYFRRRLEDAGVARWADHFVAITDEGTALAARARDERFRETFLNPGDIGGRYSALSFFGLVPAALMGQDVAALVGWGMAMLTAWDEPDAIRNPCTLPGLLMGAAALAGRDKLTLALPPELEPFGLWVEQLVAESTGKDGVGILPVAGERLDPSRIDYPDRAFSAIVLDASTAHPARERAGDGAPLSSPMLSVTLPQKEALGAEFVRWEIATAIAGALLGINPFDEPNVQQAKDATRRLLDAYANEGRLPVTSADHVTPEGVSITLSTAARATRPRELLSLVRPRDYVALLGYVGPDPALVDVLNEFRMTVAQRARCATTVGYGPRYLHSTGQLHKGGPNTGVFVLLTATPVQDVPIPGEPFSFGTLELAQALGDFGALDATGRRVVHLHLPRPDARLVRAALQSLLESLPRQGA